MFKQQSLDVNAHNSSCRLNRRQVFGVLLFFSVCNLFLVYAIGMRYLPHVSWPASHLAQVYLVCMYLGQLGIGVLLFGCIIPGIICILTPTRWLVLPLAIISMSLLVLYLVIDTGIYNTYQYHFSGFFLAMLFGHGGGEIFQFSPTEWWFFTGLVLSIVVGECILLYKLWQRRMLVIKRSAVARVSKWWRVSLCVVILGCYMTSHAINAWGYANFLPGIMSCSNTLPFYYGMTAHSFLMRHHMISGRGLQQAEEHRQFVVNQHAFHYPLQPVKWVHSKARPLNIVFIMIDTWRFDAMNAKSSPAIYDFAQRNLQFTHHWSGGDCTQPGVFSLFYSIPATYWHSALGMRQPSIFIKTLQKQGYNMSVHMSADLTVPPLNATVFSSVHPLQLETPGDSPWQRDVAINRYTIKFLRQQAKIQQHNPRAHPFFAWTFYDAVHGDSYPANFKLKISPCVAAYG